MCRHVGYLGPAVPLAELVSEPEHSLVVQSYAPRDMRGGGRVNADGFGVGWFPADRGEAVRYRRATPIWSDASLASLAADVRSGAVLAAVRSATVGMPVVETACAPFTDGQWLFSHNGVVRGWPDSVEALAKALPTTDLLTLDAPTDSALLWALVRQRLTTGMPAAEAVRTVVLDVEAAATGSRLNVLLVGPTELVATTVEHSLSVRRSAAAVTVSSEPLDDGPGWTPVPDRRLVVATATDVHTHPLEG